MYEYIIHTVFIHYMKYFKYMHTDIKYVSMVYLYSVYKILCSSINNTVYINIQNK